MNSIAKNVLVMVIAAGIVGQVTFLFQFGERLTRIETKIESLTSQIESLTRQHLASK